MMNTYTHSCIFMHEQIKLQAGMVRAKHERGKHVLCNMHVQMQFLCRNVSLMAGLSDFCRKHLPVALLTGVWHLQSAQHRQGVDVQR